MVFGNLILECLELTLILKGSGLIIRQAMDFSESSQSSEKCRLEHMSVVDRKHGLYGSENSHFGYEENRVIKDFSLYAQE